MHTDGLLIDEWPPVNTPSFGTIGYHLRMGNHSINLYDWEQFLKYADLHLKEKRKLEQLILKEYEFWLIDLLDG